MEVSEKSHLFILSAISAYLKADFLHQETKTHESSFIFTDLCWFSPGSTGFSEFIRANTHAFALEELKLKIKTNT